MPDVTMPDGEVLPARVTVGALAALAATLDDRRLAELTAYARELRDGQHMPPVNSD